MKEWFKRHWKVVAAVAAGAVGLYLLWQRSQSAAGGSPAAADTGSGLPSTGAPPASYLNSGEQAAAALAQYQAQQQASGQTTQGLFGATENTPGGPIPTSSIPIANQISGATLTGVVKENWEQAIYNGQTIWEDISGQGRNALTDVQAQTGALENTGYGPYAKGKPNTLNAIKKVGQFVTSILGASKGVPISTQEAQDFGNTDIGQVSAPSVSPVPLGPPVPAAPAAPSAPANQQTAMVAAIHPHVPGPTTPQGIPNHAVGAH